jgi:hypothetical protein
MKALDFKWWIIADALHPAAEPFTLGQTGHDLERIAKDHAVAPILIMLIELSLIRSCGNAVEV